MKETQETWVQSLDWEGPLEEEMATHSSILVWKIPRTEEPGRLHSPWGHKVLETTEGLSTHVPRIWSGSGEKSTSNNSENSKMNLI